MVMKIELKWNEESFFDNGDDIFNYIHIVAGAQGEYTACGVGYPEENHSFTDKKVNCPACIRAIKEILEIAKKEKITGGLNLVRKRRT